MDRRPVRDVIVLGAAGLVAALILVAAVGVVLVALVHPGTDVSPVVNRLSDTAYALTGAVVGYLVHAGKHPDSHL